jgi:hypothetical protein
VLKRLREAEAGHRQRLVEALGEADLAQLLKSLRRLALLEGKGPSEDEESSAA